MDFHEIINPIKSSKTKSAATPTCTTQWIRIIIINCLLNSPNSTYLDWCMTLMESKTKYNVCDRWKGFEWLAFSNKEDWSENKWKWWSGGTGQEMDHRLPRQVGSGRSSDRRAGKNSGKHTCQWKKVRQVSEFHGRRWLMVRMWARLCSTTDGYWLCGKVMPSWQSDPDNLYAQSVRNYCSK